MPMLNIAASWKIYCKTNNISNKTIVFLQQKKPMFIKKLLLVQTY